MYFNFMKNIYRNIVVEYTNLYLFFLRRHIRYVPCLRHRSEVSLDTRQIRISQGTNLIRKSKLYANKEYNAIICNVTSSR